MKTPLVIVLVCWSSLALAVGGPYRPGDPGLPHSLQGRHTLTSELSMGHPRVPHSTLRTTNLQGYDPWVEQPTGLPSGTGFSWIHAVDSNTVWAAAFGETLPVVIRTTNGGTTWVRDTVKIAPTTFSTTGIFALDSSRCWVTMYNTSFASSGGIFRTTDGGLTWTQDPTAFNTVGGYADFIHFFDANNGVAVGDPQGGYFEIYTTSNAGASWSRVPQANIPPKLTTEYGLNDGFSAAGNSLWFWTTNGVQIGVGFNQKTGRYYKTTDKGVTWTVHAYPGGVPSYGFAIGFQNDSIGLGSGQWGEVSRTTDGGSTWTRVSSPPHLGLTLLAYIPGTSGMYVGSAIWQYPSLQEGLLHGTVYTTDGGATWTGASEVTEFFFMDFASPSAGWANDPWWPNIYKWTMAQGRVIGTSVDSLNFVTLAAGQMSDTIAIDAVNFGSDSLTVLTCPRWLCQCQSWI